MDLLEALTRAERTLMPFAHKISEIAYDGLREAVAASLIDAWDDGRSVGYAEREEVAA